MDKLTKVDVKKMFLESDKKRGIEKYAEIMRDFPNVNVESDKNFQKKFNGFYRVRRNEAWQKVYYAILERGKKQSLSFEEVLREIYNETGRVESSFASKLIHTLNNDMPIWDRFVLQNLGKTMPICKGEKKLKKAIRIYNEIIVWYKESVGKEEIKEKIDDFDQVFPEYAWFSKTKKLDFILWQMR